MYPTDLSYTAEHEWVRQGPEGTAVVIGITHYAQSALGDIVFVQLPSVGATVTAGQVCGEVESTKSVSDIYAPLTGTVAQVNELLDTSPELVNTDPYGQGWLLKINLTESTGLAALLDARGYEALVG